MANQKKKKRQYFWMNTHIPWVVYSAILLAALFLWWYSSINQDFALDLLSELIGIAFIVFILDTLLVRTKTKRWKIVQDNVDYLISRTVNRLRDGISTRFFDFKPEIEGLSHEKLEDFIRDERAAFLNELEEKSPEIFEKRINKDELFSEAAYEYLNEKAEDIWDIINMKYSEYLEPELASSLITLHTHLKDTCAHIRQYKKSKKLQQAYYQEIGLDGVIFSLQKIIEILNNLRESGYSRPAARDDKDFAL